MYFLEKNPNVGLKKFQGMPLIQVLTKRGECGFYKRLYLYTNKGPFISFDKDIKPAL